MTHRAAFGFTSYRSRQAWPPADGKRYTPDSPESAASCSLPVAGTSAGGGDFDIPPIEPGEVMIHAEKVIRLPIREDSDPFDALEESFHKDAWAAYYRIVELGCGPAPEVTKKRAGLYLTDVKHHGCRQGGTVAIERVGCGEFAWEAYCQGCMDCDPDGWSTLREAVAALRWWTE